MESDKHNRCWNYICIQEPKSRQSDNCNFFLTKNIVVGLATKQSLLYSLQTKKGGSPKKCQLLKLRILSWKKKKIGRHGCEASPNIGWFSHNCFVYRKNLSNVRILKFIKLGSLGRGADRRFYCEKGSAESCTQRNCLLISFCLYQHFRKSENWKLNVND